MKTNDKNPPLVVACLATWNGEPFIEDTLASLAAQTYPNLKVLISDDASTDNTVAICERFANKDSRFQLLLQQERSGWVGNVNLLLKAAQGDYFFLVPHDDVLDPTYVIRLVEILEIRPSAILAFSDMEFISLTGDVQIQTYAELDGIEQRIRRAHRMLQQRGPWWIPYRGIFKASAVKYIGGLKTNLAGEFAADWPWLVHMSILGEFVRVPEVLYKRIESKRSLSRIWNYTARAWVGATLACGREIYRSRLSITEKMLLHVSLASACLRWAWEGLMFHITKLLSRFHGKHRSKS